MNEGSIGRRYAKALIDLGREAGLIDRFGDDLQTVYTGTLQGAGELGAVMSNPGFTEVERRAVLDQVLVRVSVHPMVQNFLRLLLEKGRMDRLGDVCREYRALADAEAGRMRATVTTATEIPAELARAVKGALERATGKQIVLETQVDAALIGGMVARVGSRVFDASLRTRLETLQLSLSQNIQA